MFQECEPIRKLYNSLVILDFTVSNVLKKNLVVLHKLTLEFFPIAFGNRVSLVSESCGYWRCHSGLQRQPWEDHCLLWDQKGGKWAGSECFNQTGILSSALSNKTCQRWNSPLLVPDLCWVSLLEVDNAGFCRWSGGFKIARKNL